MNPIESLQLQEEQLVFHAFDENAAYQVGMSLRDTALARKAPVANQCTFLFVEQ